ncbi:uncharacterized protein [Macrobrachium rosenbergii]|uniref:uncharacterized protein n=1 Tax=Macrobrachium rosenbergii TaxID=79674 RepID=UPI0034D4A1E2
MRNTRVTSHADSSHEGAAFSESSKGRSKTLARTGHNSISVWVRNLLAFFSLVEQITSATSDTEHLFKAERQELAIQWAPIVWLHSKEQFYPSSVVNFLQHIKPSKYGKGTFLAMNNGETEVILPSLPRRRQSWDTYLLASYNVECQNCPLPKYLYGEKPGRDYVPPTYGMINSCALQRKQKSLSSNKAVKYHEFLNDTRTEPNISSSQNTETYQEIDDNNTIFERETVTLPVIPISNESGRTNGTITNNISVINELEEMVRLERSPIDSRKMQMQDIFIDKLKNNGDFTFQREAKQHDIYSKQSQKFSVTYWIFYPYNQGKEICTTKLFFLGRVLQPTMGGMCYGDEIYMGNHVGDWEHITIQFEGRMPKQLYISSHNFGAFYNYDRQNHVFRYHSEDTREGIPMFPEYPSVLHLHENHPIVFAALGSHGLWPAPGTHQYNSIPVLEDKTDYGTPWLTWQNLEIIDFTHFSELSPFQRLWLSYEGRWGNPEYNCHAMMGGFCETNRGPTGIPKKRINFPCQG